MTLSAAAVIADAESAPAPVATETPAPVEGAPPPVAPVPDSAAKRFAIASQREKAMQKKRDELATAQAQIAAERAQFAQERAEFEAKYGQKPANPREALQRYGMTYRDATEFELAGGEITPEMIARQAQEEVAKLRQEQSEREETRKKDQLSAAEQQADEVIAEFKGEVYSFIETAPKDKFEMIHLYDAKDLVYDTIEEAFRTKKVVLTIEDAAGWVEKFLEKQSERVLGSGKFKARLSQGAQAPIAAGKPGQVPAQQSRTLSNSMAPTTTPTVAQPSNVQDAAMARALRALGG